MKYRYIVSLALLLILPQYIQEYQRNYSGKDYANIEFASGKLKIVHHGYKMSIVNKVLQSFWSAFRILVFRITSSEFSMVYILTQ
jgi:hypothetical protein